MGSGLGILRPVRLLNHGLRQQSAAEMFGDRQRNRDIPYHLSEETRG